MLIKTIVLLYKFKNLKYLQTTLLFVLKSMASDLHNYILSLLRNKFQKMFPLNSLRKYFSYIKHNIEQRNTVSVIPFKYLDNYSQLR